MKTVFRVLLSLALFIGLLQAAAFEKEAKAKDTKVYITSSKQLTVGLNVLKLSVWQKDEPIEGAKIHFKLFMPAMPGMPAMEDTSEAKEMGDGEYEVKVNFSMSGTWQIHIFIAPSLEKKIRVKTSIII